MNKQQSKKTTKKTRFINKLKSLTIIEKTEIITFFTKYPIYESLIDWNKKSLSYRDFEKIIENAKNSNSNKKLKSKINPELLFEGYKCRIVSHTDDFLVVMPLDWKCVVFMDSFNCGWIGAKWCIGNKYTSSSWYEYSSNSIFYLIYFKKRHYIFGRKIMLQYEINEERYIFWDESDIGINFYDYFPQNPNNYCWYLYLRYQKKIHNQLFFDFDIFEGIECSEEQIPDFSLLKFVQEELPEDIILWKNKNYL